MVDSGDSGGRSEAVKELEDHVSSVIFRAKELARGECEVFTDTARVPSRVEEIRELDRAKQRLLDYVSMYYRLRDGEGDA